VGEKNLEYTNENSTMYDGSYPNDLCGELVNSTEVQQLVSTQLSEGESVADINVIQDCEKLKNESTSWLMGQSKQSKLPAVNVSEKVETEGKKTCAVLHTQTGYANKNVREDFVNEMEARFSPNTIPDSAANDTGILKDELEDVETSNSDFDLDPIRDDSELVLESDYIDECVVLNIEEGRAPADVVFSIDTTGSMSTIVGAFGSTTRLDLTKDGAKAALDDLTEEDKVGLVRYTADIGGWRCTNYGIFFCLNWVYDRNAEEVVSGMDKLDSGWKSTVESGIDGLSPDGGTDITSGLVEAKEVLDAGERPDSNITQHIVLLTDGDHNTDNPNFANPEPDAYINANEGDYSDTFIHAIALGSDAVGSTEMEVLGNENNAYSSVRPNGTYIESSDPTDAEDLFAEVIGNIEDESAINKNATAGTPDPDKELNATVTSASGTVEEIYDTRMNVTDFNGNGSYVLKFTDTDSSNNEIAAWKMKINSTFTGPDNIEFSSDTNSDLNANVSLTGGVENVSDTGGYVWVDLRDRDSKPMLDVGSLSAGDIKAQLQSDGVPSSISSPNDYMEAAWSEVENEMDSGSAMTGTAGVSIVTGFKQGTPNGKWKGKNETANGTFSMEFKPKDGKFKKVGGIEDDGSGFGDACDSGATGDLPGRCGMNDPGNDREAVSTAQIKQAKIEVTVEGPEGRSNKTIQIPPDGEYSYDIFE
jgi:hypothetical protein